MISIPLVLLLILVVLLISGSGYGYYRGGAYASPIGALGVLLLILFVAWLLFGGSFYAPGP
jgi:hypothetical protein